MKHCAIRSSHRLLTTTIALIGLWFSVGDAPLAHAHALEQSFMFLSFQGDAVDGRVEVALADINKALGLNLPLDHSASESDIAAHSAAIIAYLQSRISVAPDGVAAALPITGYRLYTIELAQYFAVDFAFRDLASDPATVDVTFGVLFDVDPNHRNMLVVENNWKSGTFDNEAVVSLVYSPDNATQRLDLSDSSVWRGFATMVELGTHHIWIGIDHILFLFALLLPSVMRRQAHAWEPVPTFRDALLHVIKIVTVFTIAHTITLSLAAMSAVSLPSRLVESVIAISIAIAALDVIVPIFRQRIWWVVFAFGLFHGFGFASVLGDIGIPPKYLVHSLLGFNIGVELGQLAIVAVIFPVLYLLRRVRFYRPIMMRAGATALIVVAMYWFIERAFMIDLPAGAIVNKLTGAA